MTSGRKARFLGAVLIAGLGCGPAGAEERAAPELVASESGAALAPGIVTAAPPAPRGAGENHPGTEPVAEAAPPLPPEQAAFRDALRAETAAFSEAERAAIEEFYAGRDFAPYWSADPAGIDALLSALGTAGAQGMPAGRYDAAGLGALFAAPEAPAIRREAAASRAFLRYAGDLNSGVLRPSRVDPEIDVRPVRIAPGALLARLDTAPVASVLADLAPPSPDYARLIAEKARLESAGAAGEWGPAVAEGPSLHPGDGGPRVAELRARLARMGYGETAGAAAGETVAETAGETVAETAADRFDPALRAGVEAFQRDHGLNEDGVVGQHTLAEINATPGDRLARVVVNLERLRWQNTAFGERYILVNIPDYRATVYEGGAPVWTSRVVVGETKTRTAEFTQVMSFMVVNPTWHVPSSIAKRDLLPRLRRDPMALARSNMQLMTRSGTVIDPRLVDWNALGDTFPFRIRQSPSDGNALGKVKFMFPNDHAIYMHDTPHRELFARDARAFSNGCVRVQDPDGLAHLLLRDQVSDPARSFDDWVAGKAEKTVMLKDPIPVHIVYRTVFTDDQGVIRYRDDVYGRDAEVLDALTAAGVALPAA
ncbi:L,D-transpeptidase family protein [Amaricoccus solimangrovi]|uniref:Murein L,D-transpeptidase n=1 Tax=Amaricoccus solimangrovi TaxID=2589815 RepID=A0A501WTL4_9RHOB|nr:L,D-transpeptidase family protein [Amaricoccus solimangrovi]TPE51454.1 murein L,D-transpeptidase [Amaricoccus solimangrovi]